MKITVVNQLAANKFLISEKKIQKLCDIICQTLKSKKIRNKKLLNKTEMTCVFLTRAQMKKLNYNFRKKNKPTDVLSFQPSDTDSVGELVFCPAVLTAQAKKQKQSLSDELMYMFIHGLLHLLGYDHELSQNEEKIMFALQDSVFDQLIAMHLNLNCISLKNKED
jgi:probable rRNA maturation factor